ncbi:MAG: chromosome segregation protein SMC [Phycisphaerae bacterium]|nr:chromosome segregation protein SMC [Phycisphaerae bacterium]
MILKQLIVHGFKSFADRTEFEFDRGITGIVGPNGCGKSNIVDAIKWVLGSQSAKSLRGSQMLDVIFNGSGTRKSSGLSQVDLVFDNSDGRLPTDQTEVTITRRLFRSGESEYLLNKQMCRLKDIRELLLDTGIGVDAYSVIEQGKVDSLLRANPVDRRIIFEEAAGISKYKARKREAQRRLERVNQNLLRLQDIIDELERRLRSIKVQAGRARSYQALTKELRELRSTYALAEYHNYRTDRDARERRVAELSDQSTQRRTMISDQEARISRANVESLELEDRIAEFDAQLLTAQSQITAYEERLAAAQQRIIEQSEALRRAEQRGAALDAQAAEAAARVRTLDDELARLEADIAAARDRVESLSRREQQCAGEAVTLAAGLDRENAAILELVRRTSHLRNEIESQTIQQEGHAAQQRRLTSRQTEIAAARGELARRVESLEQRRRELDERLASQQARMDGARAQAGELARHRADLLDQLATAKEQRSALESRRRTLEELVRSHEGLVAGARDVLRRRAADSSGREFSYVRGPLGELIEADVEHATVVEAALGELQQYLVVTSRDALLADTAALATLEGRMLAFCLDAVPPVMGGPDLRSQEGVIALLTDWVRVPEDCERLVRGLLGRTYVVEDAGAARRLAATFGAQARFVTRDGLLIEPDGRVAAGPPGSAGGLITRRSELREIGSQLDALSERIVDVGARLSRTETEAEHVDHVLTEVRASISEAQAQRAEVQATLASTVESDRKLAEEQPLIEQDLGGLERLVAESRQREAAARQSLSTVEAEHSAAEQRAAALRAAEESLRASRGALAEELTQARVQSGELTQRRSGVSESRREAQSALAAIESERGAARHDVEQAALRIEQSRRAAAEAEQQRADVTRVRDEVSARGAAARQRREEVRREADECASELRRLRRELEEIEAQHHAEQVQLGEVRVRIDDLVARVRDELSVDLEAQYEGYVPDEIDWDAVQSRINELKEKIERLGNVNLDAISEQDDVEKRLGFLVQQRDDLRESEKQLQELIERLNAESVERFERTFATIREHFSALFKKLFGGGKAEISLENPADLLESGIEIMVRPPGKELQSMSLLSGGEKTMTAIALLLAVFKTCPSPFALLDEVDAALDEANNLRFNHVIQEFVRDTQFIIITHSKRTMSIADRLYGVTMQEAGVSKRVSVKFEQDRGAQTAVA